MSLLSRRWRHLWKHLQVFKFYDYYFKNSEEFKRFEFFVNSVLALRRSRDILTFDLSIDRAYQNYDAIQGECVEKWILDATGPHLEELYLSIDIGCEIASLLLSLSIA
ncbi:F-box/RNI/FBD-like domain protein [Trifolium medium]|uniref:F-box/RNI/FBD-like domain protein n=1 Tax=Trifolium medium TaxID=97028 RepID=A0A392MH83_9FABA|nr:F-box/RNI/FBD-like domain protein [Trifolium medium]